MRIDGVQHGQVSLQGDVGGQSVDAQRGSLRGETVTVEKSATSMLADAAEELTFAQAEREEEKDISERKVHVPRGLEILQIQEIMNYLRALGDGDNQHKLEKLVASLKGSGGAAAGQMIREAFGDVSQQFLALNYLVGHFEGKGGDPELAAALREELEALHEEHYQAIWAGLNTVKAVDAFADGDPGCAQELRECYRETVLGREALADTFNSLLQRFGSSDLKRSIDFLVRAVGDDLSARGPSTPPSELRSILEDLYQLRTLATVLEGCNEIVAALDKDFGIRGLPVDDLMKRIVSLTGERWITSDRFTGLARDMGVTDTEARINFLKRVKDVVKDIPLKVFPDIDTRDKLVSTAQEALDLAIEEEGA